MKVLVLGSGGREHALVWRLGRDPDVKSLIAAPGNPGIAALAACQPVDLTSPAAMLALAETFGADLTVVGPEGPLDRGVVDVFRHAGRPIVGPTRAGALLESSKATAKALMGRAGIPTARAVICRDLSAALRAVSGAEFGFPVVVKADGLAAGKGVVVAEDRLTAESAVRAAMEARQFGEAGDTLVIEECLTGPEVSFFVLADGSHATVLGSAQDHKRLLDEDRGPNTGGMGAFASSPLVTAALEHQVMTAVVHPVLEQMQLDGAPYRGFLYVSLMLTAAGPKVIEFNVRMGDPETQVLMPILEGPFAQALLGSATGHLAGTRLTSSLERTVGVTLAAPGYPGRVVDGAPVEGLVAASGRSKTLVFHAGTRAQDGRVVTAGGRVLTVVGRGTTFDEAMAVAYDGVSAITFDGMQFRHDIGRKAIAQLHAEAH
jgi:phosphoribosylamine--glycine ligase